ncbi:hypothetical protein [Caudoviricetes sp.]|nr:hypothetical protein [Caudoviricetes sp.]
MTESVYVMLGGELIEWDGNAMSYSHLFCANMALRRH